MRYVILSLLLAFGLAAPAVAVASPVVPVAGGAKVFLTMDEALDLAFPECEVKKETIFLRPKQREAAKKLAKVDVANNVVHAYRGYRDGKLVGTAYFDAHRVRTMKATVMFVVGSDDRIQRFELLAFAEPVEFIPRGSWYGQFTGRKLDSELSLKRGIRGVTGATLTALATTTAARRVLALHAVTRPVSRRLQGGS